MHTCIYGAVIAQSPAETSQPSAEYTFLTGQYGPKTFSIVAQNNNQEIVGNLIIKKACANFVYKRSTHGHKEPTQLRRPDQEEIELGVHAEVRLVNCAYGLPFSNLDTYVQHFPRLQYADFLENHPSFGGFKPAPMTLKDPKVLSFDAPFLYSENSLHWQHLLLPWTVSVIPRTFDLRDSDLSAWLLDVKRQGLGQGVRLVVSQEDGEKVVHQKMGSHCPTWRVVIDTMYKHRYTLVAAGVLGVTLWNLNRWHPELMAQRESAIADWQAAITKQTAHVAHLQRIIDYAHGKVEDVFTKEQIYTASASIDRAMSKLAEMRSIPFARAGTFDQFTEFLYKRCRLLGIVLDALYTSSTSMLKACAFAWYMQVCCNFAGYRPYVESTLNRYESECLIACAGSYSKYCPCYGFLEGGGLNYCKRIVMHPDDAAPMVARNQKIAAWLVGVPTLGLASYYAYHKLLSSKT